MYNILYHTISDLLIVCPKKISDLYKLAKTGDNIYSKFSKGVIIMTGSLDKRIYLIIMTALTVSGFIVICTFGQSLHRQKLMAKTSEAPPELPAAECIVKEYNGRIGVFKGNSAVPYRVIDYDFSLLSDYDKQQLTEGILIESDFELQKLIEDIAT